MEKYLPEKIKKIEEYNPTIIEYRVRLDANESPFLPSEKILNEFKNVICNLNFNRYPDPYAKKLISAFAKIYRVDSENVIAGNGSDELISIICTSFLSKSDSVLVLSPDFSMYAFYSGIIEANVIQYDKKDDFSINFEDLKKIINDNNVKLVIFSNPCNPTGIAYSREALTDFIESVDCLVVIDEAYMEFCSKDCSILYEYENYDNLIILKTLSKAFGIASLRIGFAIGSCDLIKAIKKVKSPYNVNSLSQAMATILLENYEYVENNKKIIIENTEMLYTSLKILSLEGKYKIFQTDTNFVIIKFKNASCAKMIYEKLHEVGISIRYMMNNYLRISTGTLEELKEFLEEFEKLIGDINENE